MSLRPIFLLLAAAAILRAQEPLNRPVPLLPATRGPSTGENELSREAARRAQELGFPALAVSLYRDLLKAEPSGAPAADRTDLTLALATALLDDNRAAEAEQALRDAPGPRGAAWHLRQGLAEARQGRFEPARVEATAIRAPELTAEDRPWNFFLQGMLAAATGNFPQAADWYTQAERAATTDLSRARFFLAQEEEGMRLGPVTEESAEQTRQNAQQFMGTPTGYGFERTYAVMLADLGRKGAAVEELRTSLLGLPAIERKRADDFRLLIGMIAGADDVAGRAALSQLLASGSDPDRQRVALELLRRASQSEPERSAFRGELSRLIDAPTPHPILDDLLFFRAELELGDKPPDYTRAEADARELLNKFPASQLRTHAQGILAESAWEQLRYHTAEEAAGKAREELPAGEARKELGLVVAEAWFRAGALAGDTKDFSNAADAYAAVLRDPPANVPPGELMFQRLEAQIKADSLLDAGTKADSLLKLQTVLDQFASDPAFDATNRWQAEWNFALALQLAGQTKVAYARVTRLLTSASWPPGPGGSVLRDQMAWLQAQLSFDARQYGETLKLADALNGHLGDVPALKDEIQSRDALLKARAYFALRQESDGLKTLERLRNDFPKTESAAHSYLIAADHYAQEDNSVAAQQLYQKLAEEFPTSPDAPFALYQAALQAEHQGQQSNLDEARVLIERLATQYPDSPLVFDARLTEGNLLRTLNELPQAQEVYESLRNNPRYLHRPDFVYVLLALAECDDAQSANDVGHVESARALFEDLCVYQVGAPADVRVEAGYNLGHLLAQHDHGEDALKTWWNDVVTPFFLDGKVAAQLGANGRYWMTRTLLELGERLAAQGRQDQARKIWQKILDARLPGAELAKEDIARLSNPASKP